MDVTGSEREMFSYGNEVPALLSVNEAIADKYLQLDPGRT